VSFATRTHTRSLPLPFTHTHSLAHAHTYMSTSSSSSQQQRLPVEDWVALEQDKVLPFIPWQPNFEIGLGINALTGNTTSVPFAKVSKEIPDPGLTNIYIRAVRDTDVNSELREFGGGASFDLAYSPADSFTAGVKAMIRRGMKEASLDQAFILFSATETPIVAQDAAFELTLEAQALAKSDPWRFRERYGDYFIAGAKYAVKYAVVFVQSETSEETQKAFLAKVHAGANRLDLSLAREIDRYMGTSRITVTTKACILGTVKADATPPFKNIEEPGSLEEAYRTAQWFASAKNMIGQVVCAHLRPFARVPGCELPEKVPVAQVVLNELGDLRRDLRMIVELVGTIPDHCSEATDIKKLIQRGDELIHSVSQNRTSFAYDTSIRNRFRRMAADHLRELNRFSGVLKFFEGVREGARAEPGAGDVGWRMHAGGLHTYGVITKRGDVDVTPSETVRYVAEISRSTVSPIMVSDLVVPPNEHIVGWTMRTAHENGSWKQHSHHVIFSRFPQFKFYRVTLRECTYTFQAYVVKNNKYFSALCEAIPGVIDSARLLPTTDNPPPRRNHSTV